MQLHRRRLLRLAVCSATLPVVTRIARAQAYPTRPITIVVPFPAGGPTDTIARIMAEGMRASLGQTVVVENTTGANGSIGVGRVARAVPDGYVISIGHWSTHVINGAIYPLQYDVFSDFAPVAWIATNPQLIVTKNAVPATNLKDLIAWLKANPDQATQGTAGPGSASHVAGVFFQKEFRNTFPVRAVSGCRADYAGLACWAYRSRVRSSGQFSATGPQPEDQGLCSYGENPTKLGARYSDRRRGGLAKPLYFGLAWSLGAKGHAQGDHFGA